MVTVRRKEVVSPPRAKMPYYSVLDGWRGLGILCVLAAHMLPLGPSFLRLNEDAARVGMCLFFTLSGFLITTTLIYRPNLKNFFIKRILRILPLAWAFLLIALPLAGASFKQYLGNFFFYANYPPYLFGDLTLHYWSLCLEIQFYVFIACLFAIFKEKSLKLLVPLCLFFTACKAYHGISTGEVSSMITPFRVDEVMVGCCLALAKENRLGTAIPRFLKRINPLIPLALLPIFCHPAAAYLNHFRAYVAVTLVGATIYQEKSLINQWLKSKTLKYLAKISYALYVIHPLTYYGWLGSGDTLIKYAKRPIAFLLSFGLAHLSTFYYEKYWNNIAKRLTKNTPKVVPN